MSDVNVEALIKESEESIQRMEKVPGKANDEIVKYFDRIHDKLFAYQLFFLAGYISLVAIPSINASPWLLIIPIACVWTLTYLDWKMMEQNSKEDGKWILSSVRNLNFKESDLSDFLSFYSRFAQDTAFRSKSLARSIRISMLDPEDDTQMIEGFITRDQWITVDGGIPEGIITNIRYGQRYKRARNILMEKIGMGNGLSDTFFFSKNGRKWEMVGYEN